MESRSWIRCWMLSRRSNWAFGHYADQERPVQLLKCQLMSQTVSACSQLCTDGTRLVLLSPDACPARVMHVEICGADWTPTSTCQNYVKKCYILVDACFACWFMFMLKVLCTTAASLGHSPKHAHAVNVKWC